MERTLWHPAAVQAFGNELEDNREDLAIEAEYQLTTEPLRIDVLIIKKTRDVAIKKNIAQIFRQCNIIEFKSPDDSATVATYNKTHGYARVYASLNNTDIDDLSVTVSSTRHPRDLLAFLKKKPKFKIWQEQPGIYIVEGEVYATQILVTSELSEKNNFWLANLRKGLTTEQLAQIITVAADKPEADASLYAIINANAEKMEELMRRKEGVILTEKLDAHFREKYGATFIAEGKAEGKTEEKIEIARNMKNEGFDASTISRMTGLSSAEVKRLS